MNEKFEWSGTISAPQEYPVEIYSGALVSNDGHFDFSSIWGTTSNGWGNVGKSMSNKLLTIPNQLEFTWLSLVEKKFYSGKWKLPKDTIQKLFSEGYIKNNKKETYDKFIVGLAPNGLLILWLAGEDQIEIGRYQAEEIIIDLSKTEIHPTDEYMFQKDFIDECLKDQMIVKPDVQEKIIRSGYPRPDIYHLYREKYDWQPQIILPHNSKIISVYFKLCNGEKEYCQKDQSFKHKFRAVPYDFEIVWKDDQEQEYISRIALTNDPHYWQKYLQTGQSKMPIDFEKNEILNLFSNSIKNQTCKLVIQVDPTKTKDNEWVTQFYVEANRQKYIIKEINQDSGKY